MAPKKQCTTPGCKKTVGHIGNCTGKEAVTITRRGKCVVQKKTYFRRPPGPAPRDKETHVLKVWNPHIGQWITPVISTEDPRITADSLIAMASPNSQNVAQNVAQNVVQNVVQNVAQDVAQAIPVPVPQPLAPQTQINVYAQPGQVVARPVASQASSSFASLFQQLGAQMDAMMARIVALESRVSALETTA